MYCSRLSEKVFPTYWPKLHTVDFSRQGNFIENVPETDDPTILRPSSNSKPDPNRENLLLKTPQITDSVKKKQTETNIKTTDLVKRFRNGNNRVETPSNLKLTCPTFIKIENIRDKIKKNNTFYIYPHPEFYSQPRKNITEFYKSRAPMRCPIVLTHSTQGLSNTFDTMG